MFYKRSASTSFSLKSILINIVQNACSCASIKDNWAKCFFCLVILSLTFYMIADLFLEKIPQPIEVPDNVFQIPPSEVIRNLKKAIGYTTASPREVWLKEVNDKLKMPKYAKLRPLLDPLRKGFGHEDPELIRIVREKYLIKPSNPRVPYRLNVPSGYDSSMGQALKVREIFNDMKNGFFIECGALDGETRSNTLLLERKFGWQGVLIEADPVNLIKCLDTNRKSWLVPACLSTKKSNMHVKYRAWGSIGAIVDHKSLPVDNKEMQDPNKIIEVTCIPFHAIMMALNRTSVDYFSLDVEGNELDILKTIDFNKVEIKVISAEFSHSAESDNSADGLKSYMENQGYRVHSIVTHPANLANDFIFVKNDLQIPDHPE